MADIEQAVRIRISTEGVPGITTLRDELANLKAEADRSGPGITGLTRDLEGLGDSGGTVHGRMQGLTDQMADMKERAAALSVDATAMGGRMQALTAIFGGVAAATVGVGVGIAAATVVLGPLARAAGEAEESQKRLEAAIGRTGATASEQAPRIEAAVQRIAEASVFDDEAIRNAASLFITITGNADAAAEALQPVADLAAALGIGLEESARMVARAGEGMTAALGRAGIVFSEVERKQMEAASSGERLAIVLDKINEKVGGAAASQMDTYTGRLTEFRKAWDELKETFGDQGALELAKSFFAGLTVIIEGVEAAALKAAQAIRDLNALRKGELPPSVVDTLETEPTDEYVEPWQVKRERAKLFQYDFGGTDPESLLGSKFFDKQADAGKGAIAQANELRAALADVEVQAVKSRNETAAMFHGIADMTMEIEVAFREPSTDPVEKAVEAVNEKARQMLENVSKATAALEADIAAQRAGYDALRASLDALRTSGEADETKVTVLQRELAIELQGITAKEKALGLLKQMPAEINAAADAAAKLRGDAAAVEAAREAQAEWSKFARQIDRMVADAKRDLAGLKIGGSIEASLIAQADRIREEAKYAPLVLSEEARAEWLKVGEENAKVSLRALVEGGNAVKKSIDAAAANFTFNRDKLSTAFADVFTSAVTDGAKDFGQVASAMFVQGVRAGAKQLTDILSAAVLTAFGAGEPDKEQFMTAGGGFDKAGYEAASRASDEQGQRITQAFASAIGAVQQTLEMFRNAAKGQQVSVIGSAAGFASAGASIGAAVGSIVPVLGTALGAVIGAIVGAIAGGIMAAVANAKAKKSLPYADFGIEDGEAYLRPSPGATSNFANLSEKEKSDMLRRLDEQLESVTTDYIKILLKFPAKIFAALPAFNAALDFKPGSFGNPDDLEVLRNFNEDFEQFVQNKMPRDIAEAFKAPVQAAFTAMGVTTERFNEVWKSLQGMDPKKALELLGGFADAVIQFADVFEMARNIFAATVAQSPGLENLNLNADGTQRAAGRNDFQQMLAEAEEGIFGLAMAFAALPFEDQVAAANAMGRALTDVLSNLVVYLNQIAQIERSIMDDVAQRKLGIDMDQAKGDKNLQSDILKAEYEKIIDQLRNASRLGLDPDDVEALYRRAADIAGQGYNLDPTKEAGELYKKQLDFLAELSKQQLEAMANKAQSEVDRLLEMVKPFADYMNGLPANLDPAFAAAHDALVDFSLALEQLAARIRGDESAPPPGGGTGEPPRLPPPEYPKYDPDKDATRGVVPEGATMSAKTESANAQLAAQERAAAAMERQNALLERIANAAEQGSAAPEAIGNLTRAVLSMPPPEVNVNLADPTPRDTGGGFAARQQVARLLAAR